MEDCKRARLADSPSTTASTPVPALPDEIMLDIFKFAGLVDMLHCERGCKRFRRVISANLPNLKKPLQFDLKYETVQFWNEYYDDDDAFYEIEESDNLWISFNGHNIPDANTIIVRHSDSTRRVNDNLDFLHALEEFGTVPYIIWTTKAKEVILFSAYKQLARYCFATKIQIRHEYAIRGAAEETSYCGPLHVFEGVEEVDVLCVPDARLLDEELQQMPQLRSLQISASQPEEGEVNLFRNPHLYRREQPVGLQNFDIRPFPHLQKLKIVSQYVNCFSSIDDAVLLEARELTVLVLANVETRVTVQGFGAVFDEWLNERREIDTFYIRLNGHESFSSENLNNFLHHPRDDENYRSWTIYRESDGAELVVVVKEFHVFARNSDSEEQQFMPFDYNEAPFISPEEFGDYYAYD